MTRSLRAFALLALALPMTAGCPRGGETTPRGDEVPDDPRPPIAKQVPHELRAHGQVRQDPYYWMRSDDRSDEEVLAHLRAENAYADAMLGPLREHRDALFQEIVARIPQDDASVPYHLDGYWYYWREEEGKEYPIFCRKQGSLDADEQVLLDENARAEGHAYYATGGVMVSVDGNLLAFGEDTLSRRIYTLRFKDLRTGAILPDEIEGTTGVATWALDHRTVFYVKREEGTLRAYQVWRHVLGTPVTEDVLVYHETDDEFRVSAFLSRSREYVMIGSYQTLSHEYRTVDAAEPASEPRVVLPREANHEYDVDHAHGRFYIRTNWEARDFRLMSVAPAQSQDKAAWREEIPARDGVLLRGYQLFEEKLVVSERREGIARLRVIAWGDDHRANGDAHEVAFDDDVYLADLGTNPSMRSGTLRLEYTSMTTPWTVYDYDMDSRERELKKRQRVVGDFDPANYVTMRAFATARDGTRVPISIVHRADLDRSAPQPLLLYGYGSYGYSLDPTFSSPRLSLLDRGVIFAIAHIRGGQEMGRGWYEDGKLLNKLHTFEDFIDCAEHLIEEGWTASDRLFAHGGSAGGLLMGAVANMRPELFDSIVAQVPFVDVVTTMLDESIPLTTFEYDEWGNPNEREYYEYMMRYSPYDNVRAQDYPAMLVLTGLHDSQVQYWEPMKWVARLREVGTGDAPLVFQTNMEAGHGGASGRFRRHEETALVYAFLLQRAGKLD